MTASADSAGAKWWKSAVVFQIYPSSYLDTTGNGLGDLPGILSKLDYIAGLGVDAVWVRTALDATAPQARAGYATPSIRAHPSDIKTFRVPSCLLRPDLPFLPKPEQGLWLR